MLHYVSVKGWTAEVKKFKQRLMELEKERGITQKVCEEQENELKVCTCVSLCTYCFWPCLHSTATEKLT